MRHYMYFVYCIEHVAGFPLKGAELRRGLLEVSGENKNGAAAHVLRSISGNAESGKRAKERNQPHRYKRGHRERSCLSSKQSKKAAYRNNAPRSTLRLSFSAPLRVSEVWRL